MPHAPHPMPCAPVMPPWPIDYHAQMQPWTSRLVPAPATPGTPVTTPPPTRPPPNPLILLKKIPHATQRSAPLPPPTNLSCRCDPFWGGGGGGTHTGEPCVCQGISFGRPRVHMGGEVSDDIDMTLPCTSCPTPRAPRPTPHAQPLQPRNWTTGHHPRPSPSHQSIP